MAEQFTLHTTAAQRQEVQRVAGVDPVELGMSEIVPADVQIAIVMPCDMARIRTASSHREQCSECGADVWVAATTPEHARRVCLRCARTVLGVGLA